MKLIRLTSLTPSIKVEVTEHASLNFSKGVIYSNELRNIPESEILTELSYQNVREVRKITKNTNGNTIETGLIILTFSVPTLPSEINIGYEKVHVRPYIPLPLRCRNCFRFGHSTNACRLDKICVNCANKAHLSETEECTNSTICINCKENGATEDKHFVFARSCPMFIKHKEIQAIITLQKKDAKTATKIYNERHTNATTFSSILRQNDNNTTTVKLSQTLSSPITTNKPASSSSSFHCTASTKASAPTTDPKTHSNIPNNNPRVPTSYSDIDNSDDADIPHSTNSYNLRSKSDISILPINTSQRTRRQLKATNSKNTNKKPKITSENQHSPADVEMSNDC